MNIDPYKELKKSMSVLLKNFRDFDRSSTGNYCQKNRLKYNAFIVFFHAEIEDYMESIVERFLEDATIEWESQCKVDRVFVSLVTHYFSKRKLSKNNILITNKSQNIDDIIEPILQGNSKKVLSRGIHAFRDLVKEVNKKHKCTIENNHGVSTDKGHIRNLFHPLGIPERDLDSDLFHILNGISLKRNKVVHCSRLELEKYENLYDPYEYDFSDIVDIKILDFEKKLRGYGVCRNNY